MTSIPERERIARGVARIDARLEDQRTGINRTGDITGRVAAGVALLDEALPGWIDEIDLDKLDLGSACNCILGQTWDEPYDPNDEDAAYFGHVGRLFGDLTHIREEIACGFNSEDEREFPALTAEWRRVILVRRATLTAPGTELAIPHAPVTVMVASASDPETPDFEDVCQACRWFWPCPPAWMADLPGAHPEPIDWTADLGLVSEEAPF